MVTDKERRGVNSTFLAFTTGTRQTGIEKSLAASSSSGVIVFSSFGRRDDFNAPVHFPTFNRESLIASEVNEQHTLEYMLETTGRVLGPFFDTPLWTRTMRRQEERRITPVIPVESPYALGMLRVATALASYEGIAGSDAALEYIAVKTFLNAEKLKRLEEAEKKAAMGEAVYEPEQLVAWHRADEGGKKEILNKVIQQTAESGPQGELAGEMAQRLSVFAQMHEFGIHLALLDDLALVPLLDLTLQEGAINTLLPGIPPLSESLGTSPVPVEQTQNEIVNLEENVPLTEEVFGNLIASLSHLGRNLVVIGMDYDVPYGEKGLGHMIKELQDGSRGWPAMNSGKNAWSYCMRTLANVGLVTKVEPEGGHIRVKLNRYGRRVGQALAGYLADFSERYPEVALENVLGQAGTSPLAEKRIIVTDEGDMEYQRRAALTRFKIFETMLNSDHLPISQQQLVDALGDDFDRRLIGSTLNALKKRGVIQYDSTQANTRYAYFELAENPPEDPKIHGVKEPLRAIIEWTKTLQGRPFSLEDFAQVPEHQYLMATRGETITGIFAELARQGYFKRAGQGFDAQAHSAIWLTDTQREYLTDLVGILKKIQSGDRDYLAEGRRLASDILGSPDNKSRYTALMRKAQRDSRQANSQSRVKTRRQVAEIVGDIPGIHAEGVQQALNHLYGRNYSSSFVLQLLKELSEEGAMTIAKQGFRNHYTLVADADSAVQVDEVRGSGFVGEGSPAVVDINKLSGRWLAPGDKKIHERYDGSTLPASLRDQLHPWGKRRVDDPAVVEAVVDMIRTHPGISYMKIYDLFQQEAYGFSDALVRRIVYNLVQQGYVKRGRKPNIGIGGGAYPLTWIEEKEAK